MIQKTFYVLSNGIHIPAIALGTWQMSDHEITYKSVIEALKAGYRHIDTATDYDNEQAVGLAIRDSNINRNDVFVTTKLQSHIKNYEGALAAFQNSLNLLGTDFIDLYLIHAP
jgi:diketogulonate reductase-like aldo/keto reductase